MTAPPRVSVRDATIADASAVRGLISGMGGHDDIADGEAFVAGFGNVLSWDSARAFVAQSGGRVIGYAEVHARPSTLHSCREAWLAALAVARQRQRTGVGRALVDAVSAAAAGMGCDEIVVESSSWRTTARLFYLATGFVETTPADRYRRSVWSPTAALPGRAAAVRRARTRAAKTSPATPEQPLG